MDIRNLDVRGTLFAHDAISWFGGGTQDRIKLSAQSAGSGAVILAISENGANFMPLQLRGENIRLAYRVPDPTDPNGFSTHWADGVTIEGGHVVIHVQLQLESLKGAGALCADANGVIAGCLP